MVPPGFEKENEETPRGSGFDSYNPWQGFSQGFAHSSSNWFFLAPPSSEGNTSSNLPENDLHQSHIEGTGGFFASGQDQGGNLFEPEQSRECSKQSSLREEIEELQQILLDRRRKIREGEQVLANSDVTTSSANATSSSTYSSSPSRIDLDNELERLESSYQAVRPKTDHRKLDVNELLERVKAHEPFYPSMTHNVPAGMQYSQQPTRVTPNRSIHLAGWDETEDIVQSIKTVQGSQKIQKPLAKLKKLREEDPTNPQVVQLANFARNTFRSAKSQLSKLLMHRSANYAVPKLFDVLEPAERLEFLQEIQPRLNRTCRHQHGTFAVQKIISSITDVQHLSLLVQGLRFDVRSLAMDQHATFTLQRLLSSPIRPGNPELVNAFLFASGQPPPRGESPSNEDVEAVYQAAVNKFGAMFLTVLLRKSNDQDFALTLSLLVPHLEEITCNMYGNYVVQLALERSVKSQTSHVSASVLLEKVTDPPQVLGRVAKNEFGAKVLLSSLSLDQWARKLVTRRLFGMDDTGLTCYSFEYFKDLMFNADASTLLKRALRHEPDTSRRMALAEPLWQILRSMPDARGYPAYDKWVSFLEKNLI